MKQTQRKDDSCSLYFRRFSIKINADPELGKSNSYQENTSSLASLPNQVWECVAMGGGSKREFSGPENKKQKNRDLKKSAPNYRQAQAYVLEAGHLHKIKRFLQSVSVLLSNKIKTPVRFDLCRRSHREKHVICFTCLQSQESEKHLPVTRSKVHAMRAQFTPTFTCCWY
jgi:hypothetical protein